MSYYRPTPKKWRKIGDSLLICLPILQAAVTGMPWTLETKAYVNLGLTVVLVFGKFVTNFFSEEPAS